MSRFLSKPPAVNLRVRQCMLHLSVTALVLIACRSGMSDPPDGTLSFELLPPPAPMELLPPVLPQAEEGRTPPPGPTSPGPTSPVTRPSPMPPPLHRTDRATDEIVELMEQFKSQQRDLQRMGDRDNAMADLHAEVTRNNIDYSLHLQRIHDRMLRLRSLLQQGQDCKETEQPESSVPPDSATTPNPVPAPRPSRPQTGAERKPPDDSQSMASAFIVTEQVVDRLSLANNLFAAGQVDLAQRIYAELLVLEPPPHDRVWMEYQLANCYRRHGDIKQAEKFYRIVAGSTDSLYWAERARWWMSNLSRVQGFLDRQARLASSLDQIRETFDETIRR